jgi:RNase H-like domain found in reverse transcriptase
MSVIKTDSSDYITRGILSQYNKDGVLHPIVYFLKQLNPAKYNYKIYNKELLAIIRYFKQ